MILFNHKLIKYFIFKNLKNLDLAIYNGAFMIDKFELDDWLEEGRIALVRRGTEYRNGKRKENTNNETPLLLRSPNKVSLNNLQNLRNTQHTDFNENLSEFHNEEFENFDIEDLSDSQEF